MIAARSRKIKEAMEATKEAKRLNQRIAFGSTEDSSCLECPKMVQREGCDCVSIIPQTTQSKEPTMSNGNTSHGISTVKSRVPLLKRVIEPVNSSHNKAIVVSSKMLLDESLRLNVNHLYQIPVIPLNLNFNLVKELREDQLSLRSAIKKERRMTRGKPNVTIVFAIRRPGCGACREHGLQLAKLRKQENFTLLGCVKETNVDNDALLEFYQEYFHFPIYKDEGWEIYRAMGGRKIPFFQLIRKGLAIQKRYKRKNIKNIPFGGDIWTQGGLLLFDKHGKLRYAYYENYGDEIDMEEVRNAIHAIEEQSGSRIDDLDTTSGSNYD